DAVDDRRGPLAVRAHSCGRPLDVVLGSAEVDLAVFVERPRRAAISVERRADTARVHELRSVRSWPPELQMAVAEDDPPRGFAVEHSFLTSLRLRREALDVGERRAVADEHAVELRSYG